MEDHFHAAVLLVFEGLIEVGTISEVRAAVGDEEGGVDLLLLDELGQRFEITLHMRLPAAQSETLLHDRAHIDGNRPAVDAGNRDAAARSHRSDGLVEHIGALGRHDLFLHRADEAALSMTGARFHADAIDHHIGALAFADLLDPLEDVLFREIEMSVAPAFCAMATRSVMVSIAMMRSAPRTLADWIANRPTGPVPQTATISPPLMPACSAA